MRTEEEIQREIVATEDMAERVQAQLLRASGKLAPGDKTIFIWRNFKTELINYSPVMGFADVRIIARYRFDQEKQGHSAIDKDAAKYIALAINKMLPEIAQKAVDLAKDEAEDEIFDLNIELEKVKSGVA